VRASEVRIAGVIGAGIPVIASWVDREKVTFPRGVAEVDGTGDIVDADFAVVAPRCGIAKIMRAGIVIEAVNVSVTAPRGRIAGVLGAGIVVIAIQRLVYAPRCRIAEVIRTDVCVVACAKVRGVVTAGAEAAPIIGAIDAIVAGGVVWPVPTTEVEVALFNGTSDAVVVASGVVRRVLTAGEGVALVNCAGDPVVAGCLSGAVVDPSVAIVVAPIAHLRAGRGTAHAKSGA